MQINDAIYKALKNNGYSSLHDWLFTFKVGDSDLDIDLWRDALLNLTGLPAAKYNYNDYLAAYLKILGYVGTLGDMLHKYWNDVAEGIKPVPEPN